MDFLKEIVKEIGDDYTNSRPILTRLEQYVIRFSILTDLFGSIFGGNKITAIAASSIENFLHQGR